jgi:hypothetical protein
VGAVQPVESTTLGEPAMKWRSKPNVSAKATVTVSLKATGPMDNIGEEFDTTQHLATLSDVEAFTRSAREQGGVDSTIVHYVAGAEAVIDRQIAPL